MLAHLWVDGPMPYEYAELWLVRDVYHVWPLPDPMIVARHLVCLSAESEVRRREKNG